MTLDEIKKSAEDKYNRMLDISLKITDDFNSGRRLDIEQLRNILVQVSVVSFGTVGFSIPIIGSSASLKNPSLFTLGLFFLIVVAVGGLWYASFIIESSIKGSFEGYKKNKGEIHEAISNQVFLMKNPDKYDVFVSKVKDFSDKLKVNSLDSSKINRDKVLYLLLWLLTIGVFCILFSIFPFKFDLTTIKNNKEMQMITLLSKIDLWSALSGFLGTVILFFFGLPPRINTNGNIYLIAEQEDKKEKDKYKLYLKFSYIALILIGISFLLQVIKIFR